MDVVVVGAGVFGAATALELARRGARVVHVERERPGSGTSSRGAGLVAEGMWHPTSLRLVSRSVELLVAKSREGEEVAHPFRFHTTGSTTLVPSRLVTAARTLAVMQRKLGVPVRELAADDLRALRHHEAMRVDDVAVALHYPRDGWALPRLYAEVCTAEAQALGMRIVRGEARLRRLPGEVRVEVGEERFVADAVVVAGGVWTRAFLRTGDLDAPVQAYRTQALRLSRPDAAKVPILHDAVQGFYLRPGIPQQLVAGNGTTTTPEDTATWKAEGDDSFVDATLRRLAHRFPWLADASRANVEAWAGIEAATPDRLLLAGPHPDDARVWLLAGGNGHGFMRAPAAAESLAQALLGQRPHVDLAAYAPSRFRGMSEPFAIREGFSLEEPALM